MSSFHTSFIPQRRAFTKGWSGIIIKLPVTRKSVGSPLEDNLSATLFLSLQKTCLLICLSNSHWHFAGASFISHAKSWVILFGIGVVITFSREFAGLFFVVMYKQTHVGTWQSKEAIRLMFLSVNSFLITLRGFDE